MSLQPEQPVEWIEWAKIFAPVVAAWIVFVGGFRAYAYQRGIDRRDKLREMTIQAECSKQGIVVPPNDLFAHEAAHDQFQKGKLTVFVVASDEVIRAAGKYQKLMETSGQSGDARRTAFAELIAPMRADSFEFEGFRPLKFPV